jgi:hypothetical protein
MCEARPPSFRAKYDGVHEQFHSLRKSVKETGTSTCTRIIVVEIVPIELQSR